MYYRIDCILLHCNALAARPKLHKHNTRNSFLTTGEGTRDVTERYTVRVTGGGKIEATDLGALCYVEDNDNMADTADPIARDDSSKK